MPPRRLAGPSRSEAESARLEESLEVSQQKHAELQAKFQEEVEALVAALRPESFVLEPVALRPKKTDISVERVVLAWMPYQIRAEGQAVAAY